MYVSDVRKCHEYRLSLLDAPRQSNFRVTALVFYEVDNNTDSGDRDSTRFSSTPPPITASLQHENQNYVVGSNDEPCHISG